MQTLKDEVKNSILSAAIAEFDEKGFRDASMRHIAKKAGVTAGNIYRYFQNKNELFEDLMGPVSRKMMEMVYDETYSDIAIGNLQGIDEIMEKTMRLCKEHSTELLILIYKSEGSQYEGIRRRLTELISDRFAEAAGAGRIPGREMAAVLGTAFVEGLFCIMNQSRDDVFMIQKQIRSLILFFFG